MAIVQVSRITHRKGDHDNLPQLAGAEFGWATDQRRLYIGNGTLAEGAPTVGNTEILTEHSDLNAIISGTALSQDAAISITGTAANVETSGSAVTITDEDFVINYEYNNSANTEFRRGRITGANYNGTFAYQDDFTENNDSGLTLLLTADGNDLLLQYTSTTAGTLTFIVRTAV